MVWGSAGMTGCQELPPWCNEHTGDRSLARVLVAGTPPLHGAVRGRLRFAPIFRHFTGKTIAFAVKAGLFWANRRGIGPAIGGLSRWVGPLWVAHGALLLQGAASRSGDWSAIYRSPTVTRLPALAHGGSAVCLTRSYTFLHIRETGCVLVLQRHFGHPWWTRSPSEGGLAPC